MDTSSSNCLFFEDDHCSGRPITLASFDSASSRGLGLGGGLPAAHGLRGWRPLHDRGRLGHLGQLHSSQREQSH